MHGSTIEANFLHVTAIPVQVRVALAVTLAPS
jgi:hypothetical protein